MAFTGMGDNSLEVQIEGDSTDLQAATANAKSSLLDVKKAAGVASGALAALGAGGIAAATKAAADFETQMVEVEKVTSAGFASEFEDDILRLSRELPATANELANLAAEAGRFGVAEENIESFITTTTKMAEATDISVDQAGEAFAKLSTLTDTPISKMENLGSTINSLSNTSATSSSEIVQNMMEASSSLNALGASNTEIAALSATLNETYSSASKAGRGLRRIAQEMMDPRKVSDLAGAMGMTVDQFKAMRKNDPTGLIRKMAEGMKGGGKQADALRGALTSFSRQALTNLSTNLDTLNQNLTASEKAFKENASLQREFEAAMDTANKQAKQLKSSIIAVAIQTGNVFLPAVTDAIRAVRSAVDWFGELNTKTDGLAGAVTLLTSVVGGLTGALWAFVGGPITLVPGLVTAAALAFKKDFAGIRSTTEQVLAAVSTELRKTMAVLDSVFGPAVARARKAYQKFSKRVETGTSSIIGAIGNRLVQRFTAASQTIRTTLLKLDSAWKTHRDTVRGVLERIGGIVETVTSAIVNAYYGAWADAQTSVENFIRKTKTLFRDGLAAIKPIVAQKLGELKTTLDQKLDTALQKWDALKKRLPTPVRKGIDGAITAVQEKAGRITQLWDKHSGNIREITTSVWDHVKQHPRDAIAALALILPGPLGAVVGIVSRNFTDIKKAAETSMGKLKTAVSDAATGVQQLANGEFGAAFDSLKSAAENALDGIRTLLSGEGGDGGIINAAIRSAGEWLRTTGSEVLKKGFEVAADASQTVMEDLRIALVGENGTGGIIGTIINQTEQTLSNSGDVLKAAADAGFGNLETSMEEVKTALIGEGGTGGGGGLVDTLIGNIADFLKSDAADKLAKGAGKAFGTGIRLVAEEVFNLLMWNDDSLIKSLIGDIATYLKEDAPGDLKEAAKILWDQLVQTAEGVYEGLIDGEGPLFKNMVGDIASYFKNAGKEKIKEAAFALVQPIIDAGEFVYDKLIRNSIMKDMVGAVANYFKNAGKEAIKGGFGDLIQQGLIDPANNFADWLIHNGDSFWKDTIGSVQEWLKSTGDSWMSDAFSTIRGTIENELNNIDLSGIKGALDTVISKASSAIDEVSNIPNNVSTTITRTIKTRTEGAGGGDGVDDPGRGGATRGFAHGGIVTGPVNAMIGEGGDDEAVIPLNRQGEAVLADALANALGGAAPAPQSGGGDTLIIEEGAVQVDDGEDVVRKIERWWRGKERRVR